MLSTWLLTLIPFYIISSIIPYSHGYLNLYLNRQEVNRLIGLESEIYYIKEGQVNDYALNFVMTIKPNISDLHFTWQCLINTPMPYSISLQMDDLAVLGIPRINISREGLVPTKEQVFWIGLPCNGNEDAEVNVNININITLIPFERYTFLSLRRNRICTKGLAHSMLEENDLMLSAASPKNSSVQLIYMALACFCLLCFLFGMSRCICSKMCQ